MGPDRPRARGRLRVGGWRRTPRRLVRVSASLNRSGRGRVAELAGYGRRKAPKCGCRVGRVGRRDEGRLGTRRSVASVRAKAASDDYAIKSQGRKRSIKTGETMRRSSWWQYNAPRSSPSLSSCALGALSQSRRTIGPAPSRLKPSFLFKVHGRAATMIKIAPLTAG